MNFKLLIELIHKVLLENPLNDRCLTSEIGIDPLLRVVNMPIYKEFVSEDRVQ